MKPWRLLLAIGLPLGGVVALPASASACRSAEFVKHFVHDTLPPEGEVAAEVEILKVVHPPSKVVIEARIVRMLRGSYRGQKIVLNPAAVSSCDQFPAAGRRGIVAGRVLERSPAALVIEPLLTMSRSQRERNAREKSAADGTP